MTARKTVFAVLAVLALGAYLRRSARPVRAAYRLGEHVGRMR